MKTVWDKLKVRWGVSSNWHVVMILVVFAITGFSVSFLHGLLNDAIGINEGTSFLTKFVFFMIIIMPLYIVVLYFWAIILRQKEFFTRFLVAKWEMLLKLWKK